MDSVRSPYRSVKRQVVEDVRADPSLVYILSFALLLAGVGFWHRVPNFATWDARDRLLDPLAVYGHFVSEPSIESLRAGVAWSREPFGATCYVYGIALVPVLLAAALLGELDAIAAIPFYGDGPTYHTTWQETPSWIWTWSLVLLRLVNVMFAVGCVYVTYRLGTLVRDRSVGRLSSLLLATTFGFLMLAHEVGEDVPGLFFLLCSLYLLLYYVRTGARRRFLQASALGGLAIAFKVTLGVVAFVIGLGYVLRLHRAHGELTWETFEPRTFLGGATIGAIVMLLGFPTVVVGQFGAMYERLFGHVLHRLGAQRGPDAPIWWWFLRGYVHTFGLPLAAGVSLGAVASAVRLWRRRLADDSLLLVTTLVGLFVFLFASWTELRPHHLLPTVPLLLILLANVLARLRDRRPSVGSALIAVLLLTTALYAGFGTAQYASMPRDEATEWIDETVPRNATMEVYQYSFHRTAAPHWLELSVPQQGTGTTACPAYIQINYRDLRYLRDGSDGHRAATVRTNVSQRRQYLRSLVEGRRNYELVAEFGQRPSEFVPRRPSPGSLLDLLEVGIRPGSDLYGDEQDLAVKQYTAIFERTGPCNGSRTDIW
jgi:hypothetical protein